MAESLDDQVRRLRALCRVGQETWAWDLSPNDVEAIQLAVRVLSVIQVADRYDSCLETHNVNVERDGDLPKMLDTDGAEWYGESWLQCFSQAGEALV